MIKKNFFFYWSRVDLHCCVNFKCTAKRISYIHTYGCIHLLIYTYRLGSPGGSVVKNPSAVQEMQEMWVQSLGREDPLEEGMATHFSVLA